MDEYIEKHLIDILNAATEVESYFADAPKRFQDFQNDMLRQRAVEMNVEMMGFLGIGNNPMVGCTVACAVDVATALNK